MNEHALLPDTLRDRRLSMHALSAAPAWLWSPDGTKVLWANPTGAAILGAASPAAAVAGPSDPSIKNQIANLAGTMSVNAAPRLAKLRGFTVGFGRALTCLCSLIPFDERQNAMLVVSVEPAGPHLSLKEQVHRLLAGIGTPLAFFSIDGKLIDGTPAGTAKLGGLSTLEALGVEALAAQALAEGHASSGAIEIDRIGSAPTIALMVTFALHGAAPAKSSGLPAQTAGPAPARPHVRQPLRFVWQMDADGHFTLGSDEFSKALGPRTATAFGRPWQDIASALGLDPEGKIARAVASRETWSGITLAWPADDIGERLSVELSGFPIFDGDRVFRGYRGFGICRDMARLAQLMQTRRSAAAPRTPLAPPKDAVEPKPPAEALPPAPPSEPPPAPPPEKTTPVAERPVLTVVPPSKNVVPFRSSAPSPGLSPVERKAFHEIARQLSSRLGIPRVEPPQTGTSEPAAPSEPAIDFTTERMAEATEAGADYIAQSADVAVTETIFDRLPVGVLLYRGDQVIHANRILLEWTGYRSIEALAEAGGIDRLFSDTGLDLAPETGAKTLAISTISGEQLPVEGRLYTIPWEGEAVLALVLMLASAVAIDRQRTAEMRLRHVEAEARELKSILDTATDGVIVLDPEGKLLSGNRSAEALFGYESHELTDMAFADLFAPESERTALDYLDGLTRAGVASVLNDGREVIGRVRQGGLIPLFMTMGRIGDGDEKLCAVFRDITQWKKAEEELLESKRQAEKTSLAKSEFLAKISHEIRTPLNSIIGFSEVMMEERFGPIGNERYKQYLDDIHASGQHVVSLLNDLLDLSKIEAGKLELTFTRVNLNEQVQQCVASMQPQANRERIIIRTSLASTLPQIVADARSVRQIVINLLSNSIKFTGAGGQVIVSTAFNDAGEVILRVRDTGVGMSEQDLATALEPFQQLATSARWGSNGTGLGLPLTKALVEANRASFSISSRPNAGTLVEISFPGTRVLAE